jgi:hypothetical protein
VSATGAALVLLTGEKMHAEWSRRSEALQRLEASSQASDGSLQALVLEAGAALALGLCSACAPIDTYVASHR